MGAPEESGMANTMYAVMQKIDTTLGKFNALIICYLFFNIFKNKLRRIHNQDNDKLLSDNLLKTAKLDLKSKLAMVAQLFEVKNIFQFIKYKIMVLKKVQF